MNNQNRFAQNFYYSKLQILFSFVSFVNFLSLSLLSSFSQEISFFVSKSFSLKDLLFLLLTCSVISSTLTSRIFVFYSFSFLLINILLPSLSTITEFFLIIFVFIFSFSFASVLLFILSFIISSFFPSFLMLLQLNFFYFL